MAQTNKSMTGEQILRKAAAKATSTPLYKQRTSFGEGLRIFAAKLKKIRPFSLKGTY